MASQAEIFERLFEPLTYHAPGSESSTRRALTAVSELAEDPAILDVGCGPGRQTLQLAELAGGRITAVDLLSGSLRALNRSASERGLGDHIHAIRCSMTQLCFVDECFDLIWSEGAIYCMGFAAGLEAWRRYLRPRGHLAVTELSWLTDSPPEPAREFWKQHYPRMATTEENLAAIDRAGYELVDHFVLPESDWWDHFYSELEAQIEKVMKEYAQTDLGEGRSVIDECEQEMALLRQYPEAFGYVFYVGRKRS